MSNTTASEETTKNFIEAIENYINNPPPARAPAVTKLLYRKDGSIIGLTEDSVSEDQPWIPADRKEFESKYGAATHWLRIVDGKIVDTKPKSSTNKINLEPGNTWQADKTFRLVVDENDNGDTDGWSKKSDS